MSIPADNPGQHAPAGELPAGVHESALSGIATRDAGRLNMYSRYLRPGDLVFDIGANCGEVTQVMLELGARVVAVEPQPAMAKLIDRRATVVEAAVGASAGRMTFYEVPAAPYLSTARLDLAQAAQDTNASWSSRELTVPVVTLDALIAEHGEPVFCKVDVEGFEAEVLRGLHTPVRGMSLEVHSFDQGKVGAVLAELERLGDYGLTYSRGESYVLEPWPPLRLAWFGDIYASLRA